MSDKYISIGVDIGGSHITCAAVNMKEGRILSDTITRASVDMHASTASILKAWAAPINEILGKVNPSEVAGVGFAMPGPFEYRNGVSKMKHKLFSLYDVNIPEAMQEYLNLEKTLPMRFLNDATSFAVGEAWLGKGKAYNKVVVITLGTGFGSAYIEEGIPVVEREDVAKEGCLWHLPYKEGIADNYFSTGWFVNSYKEITGKEISGAKDLADIVEKDEVANNLFVEFGSNLAECLAPWLKKFGAEVLIIGGNISKALPLFVTSLNEGFQKEDAAVNVALSELMENAALIGSSRLMDEDFWKEVSQTLPNI